MFFDTDSSAILLLEDGTYFEGLSFGAIGTGIFIMLEPHISQAVPHPGPAVLLGNWNLFLALTAFLWISMLVVLLVAERHPRACRSALKETTDCSKGQ